MNKHAQKIIDSILQDFAACAQKNEELEAKCLFRLLNFCPPQPANVPLIEKPAEFKAVS